MQSGVKFVVFSTLDGMPADVKKALPEVGSSRFVVPHFESSCHRGEHPTHLSRKAAQSSNNSDGHRRLCRAPQVFAKRVCQALLCSIKMPD